MAEEFQVLSDVIVTKYKSAGDIANAVLADTLALCVADANIIDVCAAGDAAILDRTSKIFNKKVKTKNADGKEENKVPLKGIGFPTCVSVNDVIANYSPIAADKEKNFPPLKSGDVVKVELGVHIDGYIAKAGHTIVVGMSADNAVTGKAADVIAAAHTASEAALRLISVGTQNTAVTDVVTKVAEEYGVAAIEGQLSHSQQQNKTSVEGKTIVQNPTEAQRNHERWDFENNQVVTFEVSMSTGSGKTKETEKRTTVYRKTDIIYQLKMNSARKTFHDIRKNFSVMPFSLRLLPDQTTGRMGITECAKAGLVDGSKVIAEKDEAGVVAKFTFSVLVTERGPIKLSGLPLSAHIKSEKAPKDEELVKLLAQSVSRKSKKNKKRAQELSEAK